MHSRYILNNVPFRTASVLFVLWSNSSYAKFGKNVGFFCDDESIKKPYNGDTVCVSYLFGSLLGAFALVVYISELIFKTGNFSDKSNSRSLFRLLMKFYYSGFLYSIVSTEILKCLFSELRPHFFYTCLPDMSKIDCSKGLVTYFNCTGDGHKWLVDRDIYKSFPSGHAAASVYAFVFIFVYLRSKQKNYPKRCLTVWWIRLIIPLCFIWSTFCCVSRVLDNRHFWWDVLTGVFIGWICGLYTISLTLKKVADKINNADVLK